MAASPNFAHARKIIPPATQAAMIVVCKIERDSGVYCTILDCEWSLFFFMPDLVMGVHARFDRERQSISLDGLKKRETVQSSTIHPLTWIV